MDRRERNSAAGPASPARSGSSRSSRTFGDAPIATHASRAVAAYGAGELDSDAWSGRRSVLVAVVSALTRCVGHRGLEQRATHGPGDSIVAPDRSTRVVKVRRRSRAQPGQWSAWRIVDCMSTTVDPGSTIGVLDSEHRRCCRSSSSDRIRGEVVASRSSPFVEDVTIGEIGRPAPSGAEEQITPGLRRKRGPRTSRSVAPTTL